MKLDVQRSNDRIVVNFSRGTEPMSSDFRVYTPKYAKPQIESWFILIGDEANNELLAMKRITLHSSTATSTSVFALRSNKLLIRIMSDGWMGVDKSITTSP